MPAGVTNGRTNLVAADGGHALPANCGRQRMDVRKAQQGRRAVPGGGGGRNRQGHVSAPVLLCLMRCVSFTTVV